MSRVSRPSAGLAAICAVLALVAVHGQAGQTTPQTPRFRASVELTQLDVSVVDKQGKPVRGLQASDFLVREDGKPQAVETFAAIDLPDATVDQPTYTRRVSPDVATNQNDNHRLFAIVMDDATVELNQFTINRAKQIGHSVIDKLGPDDLAAVIFTRDDRNTQNFTIDHTKLHEAVDHFTGGYRGMGDSSDPTSDSVVFTQSINTLQSVAHYLIAAPDRRKVLVYVGQGVPIDHSYERPVLLGRGYNPDVRMKEMMVDLIGKMKEIFAQAQRSNVTLYMMDACGLRASGGDGTCAPGLEMEYLKTVARNSGGTAIVGANTFETDIKKVFVENSSYYLLGYRQTNPKGTGNFTRIDVSVKKPGVTVKSRHITLVEPSDEERALKEKRVLPSPTEKAIAGILPNTDTYLRVTAAPFAISGAQSKSALEGVPASVAIVLGIREAAPADRITEAVRVLAMAFSPEGVQKKAQTQTLQVALKPVALEPPIAGLMPANPGPSAPPMAGYELLTHMNLEPGRYSLRVATHNERTGQSGSVFFDVDVPDFVNAAVTLSGVVVNTLPAPALAAAESSASLLPVEPTTVRSFARTDRMRAFLRVHQANWTSAVAPIAFKVQIHDDGGNVVYEKAETIEPAKFRADRSTDVLFEVPLSQLKPGAHVLTFEASKDKVNVKRDVVFEVR